MRATTFMCLLIVYCSFLAVSDGFWGSLWSDRREENGFEDAWSEVKSGFEDAASEVKDGVTKAYDAANDWAEKNPAGVAAITTAIGVGASVGIAALGKRDVDIPIVESLLRSLDEACPDFILPAHAPLPVIVHAAFKEVDKNKDGELTAQEFDKFAEISAVMDYCAGLKKIQ